MCRQYRPTDFDVVAGLYDVEMETNQPNHPEEFKSAQRRQISDWFIHPDYTGTPIASDLVLFKVKRNFIYNDYVRPACLPEQFEIVEPNTMCFITGFGYMGSESSWSTVEKLPDILQEGLVPIRTHHDCWVKYGNNYAINNNICIGGRGVIARDGDSGGPLTCLHKRGGKAVQVLHGISSYSALRSSNRLPSVYTQVSFFMDFIQVRDKHFRKKI